jgi:mannitol 2-dehydrogenase
LSEGLIQCSGRDIVHLKEAFGITDGWPVVCEPFEQWVLEDHFPAGRPPYEQAGVQMVGDVSRTS